MNLCAEKTYSRGTLWMAAPSNMRLARPHMSLEFPKECRCSDALLESLFVPDNT